MFTGLAVGGERLCSIRTGPLPVVVLMYKIFSVGHLSAAAPEQGLSGVAVADAVCPPPALNHCASNFFGDGRSLSRTQYLLHFPSFRKFVYQLI